MSEDRKWLWMARLMFVLSTVSVFAEVSEVRMAAAYLITAIMYSTSAILKSCCARRAMPGSPTAQSVGAA